VKVGPPRRHEVGRQLAILKYPTDVEPVEHPSLFSHDPVKDEIDDHANARSVITEIRG
jgi:hypothetical protein